MTSPDSENDFASLFAPEPAASAIADQAPASQWKVLVVDDEPDIHAVLRLATEDMVVEGLPLRLFDAHSLSEAKDILAANADIALILLDVVMETEHAGLELVQHVRQEMGNRVVRIVLVTGQPGYAPQREIVANYEIDGYRLKSELTADTIFVSVYAGLRAYRSLQNQALQREQLGAAEDGLRREQQLKAAIVKSSNDAIIGTRLQESALSIQASDDAIVGKSLDGIIESWNPGAEKIFGYTAREAIGKPLQMLIPPDRANEEAEIISRISRGERVTHFETVRRHKDGRLIDVSVSISPILDETSNLIGASTIARDITEAKRVGKALQHRQIMMEHTESMARLASFEWDVDSNVVTWSPEMFLIFGRDPALGVPNLEGQVELYTPQSTQMLFDVVRQAVSDGAPYELELMTVQPDGEERPCFIKGFPERDDSGRVVRVAGLIQDITERKRTDDLIRQLAYHDSLTHLPNRRLLNDRLQRAMASGCRSKNYGAVMFIDLDNFKPLNDTYGHEAGDLLLIEAAGRLKSCVREMDTVARFGGDEFVVMISELDTDTEESTSQAEAIAEKIRMVLSDPYRIDIKRNKEVETPIEHHCSASIGVTLFIGNESSQDDLLKWADDAMYEAKKAGRNMIRFCPTSRPSRS